MHDSQNDIQDQLKSTSNSKPTSKLAIKCLNDTLAPKTSLKCTTWISKHKTNQRIAKKCLSDTLAPKTSQTPQLGSLNTKPTK